jgi:hypothetical protein
MASQATANPILTFTTAKRCVNEGLIVHGRAQKYTERTCKISGESVVLPLTGDLLHLVSHALLDGITANADLEFLLPASAGEV